MSDIKCKKRKYEAMVTNKTISTIEDLIIIIETYDTNYYEFKQLKKIYNELIDLSEIIGMENLKKDIVKLILYEVQELDNSDEMAQHMCITGGPGVGKTTIAKIIARIILKIKGWEPEKFFIATKNDLVGRYVGQTPGKVQNFIDKCKFGCMFIDEVYSLGSSDEHDGFDKELIDTLVHNLSENKQFVCIIAGYPDETEKRFFHKNPGLKRRFGYFFNIDKYNESELFMILEKKIKNIRWSFDLEDIKIVEKTIALIKEKREYFEYCGGDIQNWLAKIKVVSAQRSFCLPPKMKRIITFEDIKEGFEIHMRNYKKIEKPSISNLMMYL